MKKLILFIMLLPLLLSAQITVKTYPQPHSVANVFNDTLKGAAATTNAIYIRQWSGTITLFFYMDTTDSGTPSALSVKSQVYNPLTAQWYDDFTNDAAFSIGAALWAEKYIYVNYGQYSDNAQADSVRWVLTPNAADTGVVRLDVGGQ